MGGANRHIDAAGLGAAKHATAATMPQELLPEDAAR